MKLKMFEKGQRNLKKLISITHHKNCDFYFGVKPSRVDQLHSRRVLSPENCMTVLLDTTDWCRLRQCTRDVCIKTHEVRVRKIIVPCVKNYAQNCIE